jgi:adenine-specific DNA-methyltransferase
LDGTKEIAQGIVAPQDSLNAKGNEKLGNRFIVGQGIFCLSRDEARALKLAQNEKDLLKPFYTTAELGRYFGSKQNELWVIYTDSRFKKPKSMAPFPQLKRHLDQFKKIITSHNAPYGLHRARDEHFFVGEKKEFRSVSVGPQHLLTPIFPVTCRRHST